MDLIIDIGNTRAKLFAVENGQLAESLTSDAMRLDGVKDFVSRNTCTGGILSTVAEVGEVARRSLQELDIPILWLTPDTPLPFGLHFPSGMGSDRIAAIIGAMTLQPGQPLLVIDAGTCVTYEFLDDKGTYLGGNIAPGLTLRLKAMHEHTALLPLVEAKGDTPAIGYDTPTAMRSGAVTGLKHEIEGYIEDFRQMHPSLQVFLTGGDEFRLKESLQDITHEDPHLVLRGLAAILNHNRPK